MSIQIELAIVIVLFFLHFVFGYLLSGAGKPYSTGLLAIHKLASLGALAVIALIVWQMRGVVGVGALEIAVIVITGLLFVAAIASGGWLSADVPSNALMLLVHKFAPYLALVASVALLYLFSGARP